MNAWLEDEWFAGQNDSIVSVCVTRIKADTLRWQAVNHQFESIYLVGPMGAGKTTVGKLLAKQLNRSFIDADQYISGRAGADIPWIFEKEGESGFRERENKALSELTVLPKIVMATGGGAVEWESNREMLGRGFVIYLDANVDTQLARTKKDNTRPLLMTNNPRQVLEERYKKRHPLYLSVADMVVPTGRAYPKQMVIEILEQMNALIEKGGKK